MSPARIVSIDPRHPNPQQKESGPAVVELRIDTGLKSGKLTVVTLSIREAIRTAHLFSEAANIAYQTTGQRGEATYE